MWGLAARRAGRARVCSRSHAARPRSGSLSPPGVALGAGAWLAAPARADDTALRFERDGALVRSLSRRELTARLRRDARARSRTRTTRSAKTYLACPLACVLEQGFGKPVSAHPRRELLPARARRLREAGERRAPRRAGRLARVRGRRARRATRRAGSRSTAGRSTRARSTWSGRARTRAIRTAIRGRISWWRSRSRRSRPATRTRFRPACPPDSPAWTGFAVFRAECVACHAINGEGGTIGPELNLPLSIVEYRPAAQLKRFIRDPAQFRYSSMPANPHLTPAQLDGLIAYFTAMQRAQARSPSRATRAVSTPARRRARRTRSRAGSAAARSSQTASSEVASQSASQPAQSP